MKLPALLPISAENAKKAIYLIDNYKRLGIYIKPIKYESWTLYLQAEQKKYINDKILTASELIDRAREVFKGKLPDDVKIVVSPIFNNKEELRGVNADYVNAKMKELHLKPSHVSKGLDLDKATISVLLSGEKAFTKPLRAAFYYYLKNQAIRYRGYEPARPKGGWSAKKTSTKTHEVHE